jgi:hypothetical protein
MVRRRRVISTLRNKKEQVVPPSDGVKQAVRDAAILDEAAKIRKDTGRLNAAKKYRSTADQSGRTEQGQGK